MVDAAGVPEDVGCEGRGEVEVKAEGEGFEDWLGAVAVAAGVDVGDSPGDGEENGEIAL